MATSTSGNVPGSPRHRRRWPFVLGGVIVLLIIIGIAGESGHKTPSGTTPTAHTAATSVSTTSSTTTSATTTTTSPPTTAVPAPTTTTSPPTTAAPAPTVQEHNAIQSAKQYLSMDAFSEQGLITQLDSPDGTKYPASAATAAVESLTVTWNAEAAKSAKQYLSMEAFSCTGLITQLDSPDGTQYTVAQATYGAQQAGVC